VIFLLADMPIDIAAFAYAAAVAGGGVLGYVKSSEFNNRVPFSLMSLDLASLFARSERPG